jgi:hypothetical protein
MKKIIFEFTAAFEIMLGWLPRYDSRVRVPAEEIENRVDEEG